MPFFVAEILSLAVTLAFSLVLIASTREIAPLFWGFAALALAIRVTTEALGKSPLFKSTTIPAMAAFGFGLYDIFILAPNILAGMIDATLLIFGVKLLGDRRVRDNLQSIGLSFLIVIGAAVVSADAIFGLIFLGYVFAGMWALLLQNLRGQWEASGGETLHLARRRGVVGRAFALAVAALTVGVLTFTLAFYFLFPRVGFRFWHVSLERTGEASSGFSERVRLGEIGRIQANPAAAVRVVYGKGRVPAEDAPERRLRGVVLDSFDGYTWRDSGASSARPMAHAQPRHWVLRPGITGGHEVLVVPEDQYESALFLPQGAVSVAGDFVDLLRTRTGNFIAQRYPGGRRHYVVTLAPPQTDRAPPAPTQLDVPDDLRPILERIVAAWSREADGLELAASLTERLRSTFRYTLDVSSDLSDRPIEKFLLEVKAGHCELFASSLALLLRVRGVPARLVNGFAAGESWDGESVVFRELHAHSWVEAYFPDQGWVSFDPTPSVVAPLDWKTEALRTLYRIVDQARFWWYTWFVNYDFAAQRELARKVREASVHFGKRLNPRWTWRDMKAWLSQIFDARRGLPTWAAVAIALGLVSVIVVWVWYRQRRNRRPRLGSNRLATMYIKVLARAEHIQTRKLGETPLTFAKHVASMHAEWREFADFTALYYELRYRTGKAEALHGVRFLELYARLSRVR